MRLRILYSVSAQTNESALLYYRTRHNNSGVPKGTPLFVNVNALRSILRLIVPCIKVLPFESGNAAPAGFLPPSSAICWRYDISLWGG